MTKAVASAIADLVNKQNQLDIRYTPERVLAEKANYIVRTRGDDVIGVVEVKRVQWYQCEISHLSVDPSAQGAGVGRSLIEEAEHRTRELGGRVAQCTIRVGNVASEAVFTKRGFAPTVTFRNERTGNDVTVYQKVVG
jgi:GNAT superfamily N-acetyltransferase